MPKKLKTVFVKTKQMTKQTQHSDVRPSVISGVKSTRGKSVIVDMSLQDTSKRVLHYLPEPPMMLDK